jgi:ABC-type lipoprotein release transport system permease subunit
MGALPGILRSGLSAVLLHPLRSAAITACVVSLLLPFIAGLAVSEGLRDEAADAARFGADLVVTGARFGRPAPLPVGAAETLRRLPGVVSVRPRIVGAIELGAAHEHAVLVGLAPEGLPPDVECVEGRLFRTGAGNELVVGSRLARRLGLSPGSRIPPFYVNRGGERVSEVVGVFRSDLPMWEANVVLASLETAQAIFDERGTATQLLVTCRDGYADAVRTAIHGLPTLSDRPDAEPLAPRVLSRADVEALLSRRASFGEGVFALHFVLLFAAAIPLLVVATGAGLRERRRETGILKMLGWGTDEVLLRAFVESLVLAAAGAALSILLAALWLGPAGARGISAVLLPGADADPAFGVPWRLAPGPVLAASALALVLVLVGTIPANWRAAAAEPMESMR